MEESDMSLSTLTLPTPTHAAMTPCRALLVAAQPEALQACEQQQSAYTALMATWAAVKAKVNPPAPAAAAAKK